MNINRNNYEEYFLLYADNELSDPERAEVEFFVQQNPDLEEELIILKQSVLKPDDTIILKDKNSIFKKEISAYEEQFLLYHDNELNLSERAEVEDIIQQDASLKKEFEVLQRLKSEADTSIVFPDKKLLYKKERERTAWLNWRNIAAAAVVAGLGLWGGINYLQNTKPQIPVGIKQTPTSKKQIIQEQKQQTNQQPTNSVVTITQPSNIQQQKTSKISDENITVKKSAPKNELVSKLEQKDKQVQTYQAPEKNDVLIATTDLSQPDKINNIEKINTTSQPINAKINNASSLQNTYVQKASYTEENEKTENYIFYNVTKEEFQKSKVGAFFKKIKRVIQRNNPLKKDSLKIGNIEIAKAV